MTRGEEPGPDHAHVGIVKSTQLYLPREEGAGPGRGEGGAKHLHL